MKLTLFLSCLILTSSIVFSQPPADTSTLNKDFVKVAKEATYPGGITEWRRFLEKNLNGSIPADNGAPVGKYTVVVQFIVDKDGSVSEIKALTHFGYGMENEVVRIINESGKWEPAQMEDGKYVKAYRKQPVTFVTEDDAFSITTDTPFTLYKGINNITINVKKVKPEDVTATISSGNITPSGNGNYTVKLNKTGEVIITLFNSKKNKQIGAAQFEVQEPATKQL